MSACGCLLCSARVGEGGGWVDDCGKRGFGNSPESEELHPKLTGLLCGVVGASRCGDHRLHCSIAWKNILVATLCLVLVLFFQRPTLVPHR